MGLVGIERLLEIYLAARPEGSRGSALEGEALGEALERALGEARAAFEGVTVEEEALARGLGALEPPLEEVDAAALRELALGQACARGEEAALRALEAHYLATVPEALARMKLPEATVEEVRQEVRRKLLVADGGPPKIAAYAGHGSLRGLIKVIATRAALSMLRKTERERGEEEGEAEAVGAGTAERDPELAYLKERYRGVFRAAFEEAVGELTPRERNLLRLHFLRRVTLESLAELYGVHRATIVRHLAKIREQLDKATQRALREQLGADRGEVESVMDLIRSRFDVSVERLLRTMEEEE